MIYLIPFLFLLFFSSNNFQSLNPVSEQIERQQYKYIVKYSDQPPVINAKWNKKFWKNTDNLSIENYIRVYPSHFPETQVKLKYDKEYIYVIFHVKDQYVKAVAKETNGKVYQDSCVEFFFTPGPDVGRGYFNLETNCKGVFLFQFHDSNTNKQGFVDLTDTKDIVISHSLEKNVENEITKPLTWVIEYRIPFSLLSKYIKVDKPESGIQWRANFYKCGDKTSHPHSLTWAKITHPKPTFHLPEFFGWLEFE